MTEKEYVEVTIRLPEPVSQFYRALTAFRKDPSLEKFLADIITGEVHHLIHNASNTLEVVVKRYGLEKWVK